MSTSGLHPPATQLPKVKTGPTFSALGCVLPQVTGEVLSPPPCGRTATWPAKPRGHLMSRKEGVTPGRGTDRIRTPSKGTMGSSASWSQSLISTSAWICWQWEEALPVGGQGPITDQLGCSPSSLSWDKRQERPLGADSRKVPYVAMSSLEVSWHLGCPVAYGDLHAQDVWGGADRAQTAATRVHAICC